MSTCMAPFGTSRSKPIPSSSVASKHGETRVLCAVRLRAPVSVPGHGPPDRAGRLSDQTMPRNVLLSEPERDLLDGMCRAARDGDVHPANPATRLIDVAMITAPRGNDSHACRSAVRRICLVWMSVSETWNVMPIVKDR